MPMPLRRGGGKGLAFKVKKILFWGLFYVLKELTQPLSSRGRGKA